MTGVTLHPTPRWRDVVLEQVRMVGSSLRPVGLVVAIVLAIGTFAIGKDLLEGGPGFDSTGTFPTMAIAFLWPFAVWWREQRFRPALLWTLPVERRRLALARVIAGFAWLMTALAAFAAWLVVLALIAGAGPEHHVLRIPLVETVAAYLFGSALLLGLSHPLRWLLGAAGVLFLMGDLGDVLGELLGGWSLTGSHPLFIAEGGDVRLNVADLARWAVAALVLLGGGLVALAAALWRHREHRRP